MATRFLALLGADPARLAATTDAILARTHLSRALAHPDFVLLADPLSRLVMTADRNLAVVGRLFARNEPGGARPDSLPGNGALWSASEILGSYWGQYVAFIRRSGRMPAIEILRDPSGGLPCYMFEHRGVTIVCSDIDIALQSGCFTPSLDWSIVFQCLWVVALRTDATALAGFREIPCGQSLVWGAAESGLVERWSPWDHVGRYAGHSDEALCERLRSTIRTCVTDLAGCFDHIMHCLSGGLDSSIVAVCLAEGRVPVTTMNLLSRGHQGDERHYAEAVARHCGMDLIEHRYSVDDVDIDQSSALHLPRPVGAAGRLAFDRAGSALASAVKANAQFSGNGGDNVFCFLKSVTPVIDRARREGWGSGTWRTVLDVSRLTDTGVGTVLRHVVRKWKPTTRGYRWRTHALFLDADGIAQHARDAHHPWLSAPPGALAGDAAHVAAVLLPFNYIEGHPRDAASELVTPLLSQPIMELCLGIPSWRWCVGGRDRALVRRAFADDLPAIVTERKSKGGPAGFYQQIVEQRGTAVREHLQDGLLAAHGFLDRAAIDAYFQQSEFRSADEYVRILSLSDAESWARAWQTRCADKSQIRPAPARLNS